MIGVPSSLFSGRGPRLSVLNRHAGSSLLKLLALIWSSGEYLLPLKSAVYIGHSPFFVLGCPVFCPWRRGTKVATPRASRAIAGTTRTAVRFIIQLLTDSQTSGNERAIIARPARVLREGSPVERKVELRRGPAGPPRAVVSRSARPDDAHAVRWTDVSP